MNLPLPERLRERSGVGRRTAHAQHSLEEVGRRVRARRILEKGFMRKEEQRGGVSAGGSLTGALLVGGWAGGVQWGPQRREGKRKGSDGTLGP